VATLTEDQVRDWARKVLDFGETQGVTSGFGQLTSFKSLGFAQTGSPDGWYLPSNSNDVAIVVETKRSDKTLGDSDVDQLLKYVRVLETRYLKVVGILTNNDEVRVYRGTELFDRAPATLQSAEYYLSLFTTTTIDKAKIYELTQRINNLLHYQFAIKNLYHRMIFTACTLVAKRYDALLTRGMDYQMFQASIISSLNKALRDDKRQSAKLQLLVEVFASIEMNVNTDPEDEVGQNRLTNLIGDFIDWVTEISENLNSDAWRGEDVMGIFFNEFSRYRGKSEAGQVLTPEHITDFMYRILEVGPDDRVLDACCGSGAFLVKAMSNMIQTAGGVRSDKAKEIKAGQLYGIDNDREMFALACANMLIHKDGKTNLEQMDARHEEPAGAWIAKKRITKVLMNPPFEKKYGCVEIVENVLNHVPRGTACAFIMPDKKLEKEPKARVNRILKRHRLRKIVKLPEDLFFGVGVTTSVFVFEAGVPQGSHEVFACFMESDGLVTVKNKGRHDVYGRWPEIENRWVEIVTKQTGDDSVQWHKAGRELGEHLSWQAPPQPFTIAEEDFQKVAMDYAMFQRGIDAAAFERAVLSSVLYASDVGDVGNLVTVRMEKHDG